MFDKIMHAFDFFLIFLFFRGCDNHRLVLKWHPDKNKGKEQEAQVLTAKLNNAYEILGDADERRR